MAIYRLLSGSAFEPEEIELLIAAYERCLEVLNLKDKDDPRCELLAAKIISIAQAGDSDPHLLAERAISSALNLTIPMGQTSTLTT